MSPTRPTVEDAPRLEGAASKHEAPNYNLDSRGAVPGVLAKRKYRRHPKVSVTAATAASRRTGRETAAEEMLSEPSELTFHMNSPTTLPQNGRPLPMFSFPTVGAASVGGSIHIL